VIIGYGSAAFYELFSCLGDGSGSGSSNPAPEPTTPAPPETPKPEGTGIGTGTWAQGSYSSPEESLIKHFEKHGAEVGAENVEQYLRQAEAFADNLKGARKVYNIPGVTPNVTRYYKNGKYIDMVGDWIISFGKQ
jgi:hypothetical protein